ncbi:MULTISPECIES: hypothetical protein [unclassified Staphylococcus]|uniref:hypothetical protein n=1 Tax=unclassified Staphylococcus TaxID=91994 RepID=UPI0021CFA699|nr:MULTISPECIES: hypothetical protein [unclassified Staphylococcus]UXR79071.1 hypothetical protein MUA92_04060 [Staphylococcus sp. IVB6227]UXR81832.1 hypothetical protein MUA51_06965 [Staphylococcus sp. IVB6214]
MKKVVRNVDLSKDELDLLQGFFDKEKKINQIKKEKFDTLSKQFIDRCVARGLSDETIRYYNEELKVFRYFLVDCVPELLDNFLSLSPDDIEKFKRYLLHVRGSNRLTSMHSLFG